MVTLLHIVSFLAVGAGRSATFFNLTEKSMDSKEVKHVVTLVQYVLTVGGQVVGHARNQGNSGFEFLPSEVLKGGKFLARYDRMADLKAGIASHLSGKSATFAVAEHNPWANHKA